MDWTLKICAFYSANETLVKKKKKHHMVTQPEAGVMVFVFCFLNKEVYFTK